MYHLIMDYLIMLFVLIWGITTFFFLINLKWCVNRIRDICSNSVGYTKFIQLLLICLLGSLFVIIFLYYLINEGTVDRIDIFMTVIVGWLGAIIGSFFGERSMEHLTTQQKENVNSLIDKLKFKDQIISRMTEKLEKLERK